MYRLYRTISRRDHRRSWQLCRRSYHSFVNSSPLRSGLSLFLSFSFPSTSRFSLSTWNSKHLCREHRRAHLSPSHQRQRNATTSRPRRACVRISKPLSVHFFPYLLLRAALRDPANIRLSFSFLRLRLCRRRRRYHYVYSRSSRLARSLAPINNLY